MFLTRFEKVPNIAIVPFAIRRRHESLDIGAQQFLFTIAEHSFGGGAEGQDQSAIVHDDHRVGYRREDRAEVVFLRPQRVLGGPTFGDVRHYRRKAAQIAVGRMESGDSTEERRVGKGGASTVSARWTPD